MADRLTMIERALERRYLSVSEPDRLEDERWLVEEVKRLRAAIATPVQFVPIIGSVNEGETP